MLALMPMPGDVDLVIASELMEAGRALNGGLVTDRTTVITSTSRVYSIAEKSNMGDGRLDSAPVLELAKQTSRKLVAFDMEAEATRSGCAVSAVLLGALAGSAALPFARHHYEDAIRASGLAVATNLAGFNAGFAAAATGSAIEPAHEAARATTESFVAEGIRRLVDYQDRAYADLYLERLRRFEHLDRDGLLVRELSRYLALWMSYEDTARVADLKTRSARFARVRKEVSMRSGQIVHHSEFLHPRIDELCDILPAALGTAVMQIAWLRRPLQRLFRRGRQVTTSKLHGFLLLYSVAIFGRWRRRSLRYRRENDKIESWLDRIASHASTNYELAVEVVRCQRVIKGYGDTYERGWRSFRLLMEQIPNVDAPGLALLRNAALADDKGEVLTDAIRSMANRLRPEMRDAVLEGNVVTGQ